MVGHRDVRAAGAPDRPIRVGDRHAVDREDRVGGPGDAVRRERRDPEVVVGGAAEVGGHEVDVLVVLGADRGALGDRDRFDLVTLEDGDPRDDLGSGCPPRPARSGPWLGGRRADHERHGRERGDHERSHRHALHHVCTVILWDVRGPACFEGVRRSSLKCSAPGPPSVLGCPHDPRGGQGLDLGARSPLPGLRLRHECLRRSARRRTDEGQRRRLGRPARARENPRGTSEPVHVVLARIRLSCARCLSPIRATHRSDAERGRSSVPELGPGCFRG